LLKRFCGDSCSAWSAISGSRSGPRKIVESKNDIVAVEIDLEHAVDRLTESGELVERGLEKALLQDAASRDLPFVVAAALGLHRSPPPEQVVADSPLSRVRKRSMPSSSDQTRVGRTLTLGGGVESSLEGSDIELSGSPKDIRTSPYDLCANRSDRRQSREGDRCFESTSLQRRVQRTPKLGRCARSRGGPTQPAATRDPASVHINL